MVFGTGAGVGQHLTVSEVTTAVTASLLLPVLACFLSIASSFFSCGNTQMGYMDTSPGGESSAHPGQRARESKATTAWGGTRRCPVESGLTRAAISFCSRSIVSRAARASPIRSPTVESSIAATAAKPAAAAIVKLEPGLVRPRFLPLVKVDTRLCHHERPEQAR